MNDETILKMNKKDVVIRTNLINQNEKIDE